MNFFTASLSSRNIRTKISTLCCLFVVGYFCVPVLAQGLDSTGQDVQMAVKLLEKKDYIQAIERLHLVEERIPDPEQIADLLAVAYLGRGFQLLAAGDFYLARKSFLQGRQYNEDDARLWHGEALAWFSQGRYAEAVSVLAEALAVAPQNADLYHLLGKAYYAEGSMTEAVNALTIAAELGDDPSVAELLVKVRREWLIEREMQLEVRGHFQLSYVDGEHASELAVAILETLEDAYTELGSELGYYPEVRVPVLIYSQKEFSALTHSPDWAGAVYDGKIRLPIGGMPHMTEPLAAVLYHEYTHVLVHFMAQRGAPVWLNEGLAEVAGRRIHAPATLRIKDVSDSGLLFDWDDLAGPFTRFAPEHVPQAYEQSYSLVYFMIEQYGWHKMAELLQGLGRETDWQTAIAATYIDYGLDWPAILSEWQAGMM